MKKKKRSGVDVNRTRDPDTPAAPATQPISAHPISSNPSLPTLSQHKMPGSLHASFCSIKYLPDGM
jgi:hypothetical protein